MIHGIVGLPGQGKTLLMAKWAAADMAKGLPVAANFRLLGADYVPTFGDFLLWCASHNNGVLYIDEAGIVLNSRNWQSVPFEIMVLFAQHRHRGLDLIWAAQTVGQVDKSLRDLTQYISRCRKTFVGWPSSPLPGGGYWLVPRFRVDTYESDRLKKVAWSERFLFSSRWAEMYATADILSRDQSEATSLAAGLEAWQQARRVPTDGLRIR